MLCKHILRRSQNSTRCYHDNVTIYIHTVHSETCCVHSANKEFGRIKQSIESHAINLGSMLLEQGLKGVKMAPLPILAILATCSGNGSLLFFILWVIFVIGAKMRLLTWKTITSLGFVLNKSYLSISQPCQYVVCLIITQFIIMGVKQEKGGMNQNCASPFPTPLHGYRIYSIDQLPRNCSHKAFQFLL